MTLGAMGCALCMCVASVYTQHVCIEHTPVQRVCECTQRRNAGNVCVCSAGRVSWQRGAGPGLGLGSLPRETRQALERPPLLREERVVGGAARTFSSLKEFPSGLSLLLALPRLPPHLSWQVGLLPASPAQAACPSRVASLQREAAAWHAVVVFLGPVSCDW